MKPASRVGAILALGLLVIGPTAASAQAPISLKLGVLTDLSGINADFSGPGSVVAAQMAVEDFKAETKGLKVEVISADHQNKPDIGSGIARRWFDQEGVDAILDVPNSAVALAVSQITREKDKVLIVSGGGTSDLTGTACSPNTIHWTFDTWALAHGTGSAIVKRGGDTWYFITADYAFGQALERDTAAVVTASGGKVLGSARHPPGAPDFSSYLLQAQASKAKIVGVANAAGDTINTIKQASEFGITQGGQNLAGLLIFVSDVHALGLKVAQGLTLTAPYYWDQNDGTRAFAKRFAERRDGRMPTYVQAGVYSGVTHYLNAVAAAKTKAANPVIAKMKATPADDPLFGKGEVRPDGRVTHAMYLFQVKTPGESKSEWDVYKQLATIPAAEAFRPIGEGKCPLVK